MDPRQAHLAMLRTMPSEWCLRYRYIADDQGQAHPLSFKHREWQRDILDDLHPRVVIMKAAQLGLTELAMSRAMHAVDVLGVPVLYTFPTKDDASDFSAGRFDPMLAVSPHLEELFTDVSNVSLKRAGTVPLYLRGCTRRQLKSIPVAMLFLDEIDEMSEEMIELARQRVLAQANPCEWNLSTPCYPGTGVHTEYLNSDQRRWLVPCPHCGERQALEWDENLHIADTASEPSWFKCARCEQPWTEAQHLEAIDAGEWVASNPGAPDHGYHISQLYGPSMTAERLAKAWREAQRSAQRLTEFYNSVLGLPFEAQGLSLTKGKVRECCGDARMIGTGRGPRARSLGIDVGLRAHCTVLEADERSNPRVLWAGTVGALEEADFIVQRFGVQSVVVDALPERHKSLELRARLQHLGLDCLVAFYPNTDVLGGLEVVRDYAKGIVQIHRTSLCDRLALLFDQRRITLPGDVPDEYVANIANMFRATVEPAGGVGQPRAVWKHRGPDHYFHATLYAMVALEEHLEVELGELPQDDGLLPSDDQVWHDAPGFGGAGAPLPIEGLTDPW